jgi:glyoxylate/hydroxypyruvate reductase A
VVHAAQRGVADDGLGVGEVGCGAFETRHGGGCFAAFVGYEVDVENHALCVDCPRVARITNLVPQTAALRWTSPRRSRTAESVAHSVVLTLPLAEETNEMLDATATALMRTGAVMVDLGRGGVVDEAALVRAIEEGRLAGAALDVFATEPLPSDGALWDLPNVFVSPHTAGLSVYENEWIVALSARSSGATWPETRF